MGEWVSERVEKKIGEREAEKQWSEGRVRI